MPAISVHHTATDDGAWDGPANKTRVKTDQPQAYFARIYAHRDADGDARLKTTYRFIHHFISADGGPGAASTVACSTGIGVLNGARGGTIIPSSDRSGVWRHMAAHLRDADMEPPELSALGETIERKVFKFEEVKADDTQGEITGVASVYGVEDLQGDIIERGAFTKTISENPEVPILWQHDAREVIGRGAIEDTGKRILLRAQLDMDDPVAVRVYQKLKKGLIKGLSIGFQVLDAFVEQVEDRFIRRIRELKLWEVSVVTFQALPAAQVTAVKQQPALPRQSASEVTPDDYVSQGADEARGAANPTVGPAQDHLMEKYRRYVEAVKESLRS